MFKLSQAEMRRDFLPARASESLHIARAAIDTAKNPVPSKANPDRMASAAPRVELAVTADSGSHDWASF